jgi:hypothetical protein
MAMASDDVQDLVSRMSSPNAILTALIIVLVVFTRGMVTKPKTYRLFPVWAVVEIALTSYLLPQDGLGRRIL